MGGSRHVASQACGVFFHYYHDYMYSIYYEKLLNINCIMNGVDGEWIESSGAAGAQDWRVSSPFKLPARYVYQISSSKDFLDNCLIVNRCQTYKRILRPVMCWQSPIQCSAHKTNTQNQVGCWVRLWRWDRRVRQWEWRGQACLIRCKHPHLSYIATDAIWWHQAI